MRSPKEIRDEVRRIRERVKNLSGYWIGEAAAGVYALEWVLEKRETQPAEDIGHPGGGHERIAAALLKAAESNRPAAPASPKVRPLRAVPTKKR